MALSNQLFSNNAVSLLAAPITATDTEIHVLAGHGALFPQPVGDGSDFFLITLENQAATVREIVRVTARVGDTLSFTLSDRAQEGTTALAWSASLGNDTLVDHRVTAGSLRNISDAYVNPSYPQLDTLQKAVDYLLIGGSPGARVYDSAFSTSAGGGKTVVTLPTPYAADTTALWVGGQRMKRGIDFVEIPAGLEIQFEVTASDQSDGQAIVVDYTAA